MTLVEKLNEAKVQGYNHVDSPWTEKGGEALDTYMTSRSVYQPAWSLMDIIGSDTVHEVAVDGDKMIISHYTKSVGDIDKHILTKLTE